MQHRIGDSYWTEPTSYFPLDFTIHDKLYPLLRIPRLYKGTSNPYFGNIGGYARSRVMHEIRPSTSGYAFKYKIRRRGIVTLYSGFYSIMGISKNLEFLPSSLKNVDKKYRMYGEPDVFALGVVELKNLPDFKYTKSITRYSRTNSIIAETFINPENVTILVNKEKLRKTLHTKELYTATVRNEMLWQLKKLQDDHKVKIKDVPDEYLKQFVKAPEGVKTNSLVEAMKIEADIKDSVFSNLNTLLV